MKIWLINHYAVPPQYYPLARPSLFAKNLMKMGHEVTIVAASTIHNSASKNLIEDDKKYICTEYDGVPYVLINCMPYQGNGLKRIINIWEFAAKLPKVLDKLEKPEAIVATSFDPISCYAGIKYAKKHKIKAVAEIADLWPETLVEYGNLSPKNPIVLFLRQVEKRIYVNANAIVFTMEGAYDYIVEQGWEKIVPKSKVYYINNGIDLEMFDYNKKHFITEDKDLHNPELFKVIYAGAIRKVNNLDKLLDVAKLVKNPNIKFLIWGDGDELSRLKERQAVEQIDNVVFKGHVEKRKIPYITSKANLNFAHNNDSKLFRFGISFNKIFDYLASGRPILCDFKSKYNPVLQGKAGFSVDSGNENKIAEKIDEISRYDEKQLSVFSNNARCCAEKYDFKILTSTLIEVIENA